MSRTLEERLYDVSGSPGNFEVAEHRDFVGVHLMPQGTLDGFKEDQFHRNLAPDTLRYSFEGIQVNLRQLQKELAQIEKLARNWHKLHNPW